MSCSVCGSNSGCGCSGQIVGVVLNRQNCNTSNDCCQNTVPNCTPAPYYNCAQTCEQGHSQKVVLEFFSPALKILDSWNVPACSATATITVEGLHDPVVIGSYIWNPSYGFFEITAFNPSTSQITVTNTCHTGNAAAGTNVPSCTGFVVQATPCDCPDLNQVCVAIDFTAPANGDCLDITLTSQTGLVAGDTVQIGSGFYFLQALKPNEVVTICNQGQGITPGTSVIAKDANGNYQYCLSIISTNPCSVTAEGSVVPLGCNGSTQTVPLGKGNPSWVVTKLNANDNKAAYRPLGGDDSTCSTFSTNFTIVGGTSSYTNVNITSTTPFVAGDILVVDGYPAITLTVDNVPSANQLDFTISPAPVVGGTILSGTVLCLESCCDTLLTLIRNQGTAAIDTLKTGITISAGSPNDVSNVSTLSFTNSSPTENFIFLAFISSTFTGNITNGNTNNFAMSGLIEYQINGGGYNGAVGASDSSQYFMQSDSATSIARSLNAMIPVVVPPSSTVTFDARTNFIYYGSGTGTFSSGSVHVTLTRVTMAS